MATMQAGWIMWMLHASSGSAAAALEVIGVDGYNTAAACVVVGVGVAGIITAPIVLGVGGIGIWYHVVGAPPSAYPWNAAFMGATGPVSANVVHGPLLLDAVSDGAWGP